MDIELLITQYLADKADLIDQQNDSLNIINNQIYTWNFANIPCPTTEDLAALEPIVQAKLDKEAKIKAGQKARQTCLNCLDLIAGHNLTVQLTADQITTMQSQFAPIQSALMTARPTTAKSLITALEPDGILVTQELKDAVLSELAEY